MAHLNYKNLEPSEGLSSHRLHSPLTSNLHFLWQWLTYMKVPVWLIIQWWNTRAKEVSSLLSNQTDLTGESLPVLRLQEAVIDLVGSGNHGRHRILVARWDDGEEGESSQGQVVHTTGHTALIIAVWVQAGRGGRKDRGKGMKEGRCSVTKQIA